jgi:hypothetical protein
MWAREARGPDGKRPASVKESERWIEGYERVAEQAAQLPATRLVYVADREADMMGMIRRAHQLETPADWLVRAKHDRCLADGEGKRLWSETTADMPLGEIGFLMEGRGKQKARQVRQQIWAKRVLLRDGRRGKIEATCIVAREVAAPAGVKPVEWRLLTNRRAETLADACELIDWYRARWEIEIFFNVLKNGCDVEELQLSAMDRLERALALFLVVAWRIAYLMRKGRTCPDLDATLFFDPDEIRAAYLLNKKKAPVAPAPSLSNHSVEFHGGANNIIVTNFIMSRAGVSVKDYLNHPFYPVPNIAGMNTLNPIKIAGSILQLHNVIWGSPEASPHTYPCTSCRPAH